MVGDPLQRLFNVGVVGTMSDPQLLDRFISRRDEAAEAAFEELMCRHGPMVLRVCRAVLRDPHDAEDAFQAVFLVLACRAGSIRRRGSIASWLFGVAHRVATRARRGEARRRRLGRQIAERSPESTLSDEGAPDWQVLHGEIEGLPERLRAPVVLCYLQGLTQAAAAHRLGVSEVAVRGRLARARERLRHRLTRRGVTIPAGLLVAGTAAEAQASVPVSLVHSTARIVLGFAAGNAAAVLARGVLNAMLLRHMKVVAVLLFLGIGGTSWAWHAFAGAVDEKGQAGAGKTIAGTPTPANRSAAMRKLAPSRMDTYPITINGRAVDPDGKPVAAAHIYLASRWADYKRIAETVTDADGRYVFRGVELPIERAKPNAVGGRDVGSFQVFGQADGFGFAWRDQKWFYPRPKSPNVRYEPELRDPPSHYEANDKIDLDLRFLPPARLSGKIVDDRGKPLTGVRLEIRDCESLIVTDNIVRSSLDALNERDTASPTMKRRRTDDAGRFAFEGLPASCRFRIHVRAEGFPDRWIHAATSREPQPDQDGGPVFTGDFNLTLPTPVDVPIKVVYADTGQPAPRVMVQAAHGLVNTSQTTDDRGRVVLRISPGEYQLQNLPARGTPYLVTDDRLAVDARPLAMPAVFQVRPAAIVEVTVVDADTGAGLPDVDLWERIGDGPQRGEVYFRSWEVATRVAWVERPRTDAHGKLRAFVEPGRHRFGVGWQFQPPFYDAVEPQGREVECRAGQTVAVKFAMRRSVPAR